LLGLDYLIGVYARVAAAYVPLVVELPVLVAVALRSACNDFILLVVIQVEF
jgi:hypothetical protein